MEGYCAGLQINAQRKSELMRSLPGRTLFLRMDWIENGLYTLFFNELQRPSRSWVTQKARMRTNKLLAVNNENT